MKLLLKIQVCFVFIVISMHSFSQLGVPKPEKRKIIAINDPVRKSIDSLRKLLSGYNLAIQANRANSIYKYKRQGKTVSANRTGRITAACTYFCGPLAGPLPVTEMELSGERINETTVKLTWKTETEIDNRGFYIERTFDPASAYISRDFVAGAGTSYTTLNYLRNDPNDFTGITYYRLRQVDINGQYKYSNVVPVNGYTIKPGIAVLPNPGTNSQTIFRVAGFRANEIIDISITDVPGRTVAKKKITALQNRYIIPLSAIGKLSSGYYYIILQSKEKKVYASFVIID
jgi:Secretion system C-terminal sorting domain